MSQISTAPNTPAMFSLHDPLPEEDEDGVSFGRLGSGLDDDWETTLEMKEFVEEVDPTAQNARICVGLPPLKSDLGKWAAWTVEWEKLNGEFCSSVDESDEVSSNAYGSVLEEDDDDASWESALDYAEKADQLFEQAEYQPRMCVGLPPMSSDLGKWATWMVRWEEANGIPAETPPLTSELGKWAENLSEFEKKEIRMKVAKAELPPLTSELGKWAEILSEEEKAEILMEVEEEEAELPPLTSDLGKWAEILSEEEKAEIQMKVETILMEEDCGC